MFLQEYWIAIVFCFFNFSPIAVDSNDRDIADLILIGDKDTISQAQFYKTDYTIIFQYFTVKTTVFDLNRFNSPKFCDELGKIAAANSINDLHILLVSDSGHSKLNCDDPRWDSTNFVIIRELNNSELVVSYDTVESSTKDSCNWTVAMASIREYHNSFVSISLPDDYVNVENAQRRANRILYAFIALLAMGMAGMMGVICFMMHNNNSNKKKARKAAEEAAAKSEAAMIERARRHAAAMNAPKPDSSSGLDSVRKESSARSDKKSIKVKREKKVDEGADSKKDVNINSDESTKKEKETEKEKEKEVKKEAQIEEAKETKKVPSPPKNIEMKDGQKKMNLPLENESEKSAKTAKPEEKKEKDGEEDDEESESKSSSKATDSAAKKK